MGYLELKGSLLIYPENNSFATADGLVYEVKERMSNERLLDCEDYGDLPVEHVCQEVMQAAMDNDFQIYWATRPNIVRRQEDYEDKGYILSRVINESKKTISYIIDDKIFERGHIGDLLDLLIDMYISCMDLDNKERKKKKNEFASV